ncbi:hypothetical protein ACODM8_12890 [Vibrio ostreicida]|uniref:Uncharacterized protein n=1 Tax=Vibrio ostreicida TaxID=526588 RepID=A0ABT8BYI4_9VIBR|nr:hypothetical protein [Vibrio ostreicida]MDN3611754.1 hypothetical protein [Vibrio ostreicida]NPD09569.1 hypothetical protein [Vibrio ostreicida]
MRLAICLMTLLASATLASTPPDDEKLIQLLVERGIICENQSYQDEQTSLQIYLSNRFSKTKAKTSKEIKDNPSKKACIAASSD